jgi:DNA ligase-1
MLRFASLAETAERVSATRSRNAKVRALTEVLASASEDELPIVVGFLIGEPRQRRLGVGWGSLALVDDIDIDVASDANTSALSVLEIDAVLTELARTGGPGSVAERTHLLGGLRARSTDAEWDLLKRLLLGDLRIGALGGLVLDAIALAFSVPADGVRRAHLLTGDLGATSVLARSGVEQLIGVRLSVLRPVQPMLAATSGSVTDAITELGRSSVEWKLDGARIQVHRHGSDIRIVTRNLNDVTDRLPEVVALVRSLPVNSVVLDGEVLRMRTDGRPEPFQDTMSRFGSEASASARSGDDAVAGSNGSLRAFFFDCMHLDGTDLLDRPLHERAQALARSVGGHRVPSIVTDDPAEAQRFADAALDLGHEGVMVKAIGSTYEAGRRGSTWRKVKPVRTLDLVVIAAEWGHGRRQGRLSNLHLAARADDDSGFVMVGKTFKGLTDAVLESQTAELLERETSRQGITVFVRPELVVEIALDGVQRSTRYPGGVALRFARVRHYRPDRSPADADRLSAVRSLLA